MITIAVFACACVVAVMIARQFNKDVAILLSIGCGALILISVLDELFDVVHALYNLSVYSGVDGEVLGSVVKIIGIGYLTEFCGGICADADCKSLGDKVTFAGKISIALIAMPLLVTLIKSILALLPV